MILEENLAELCLSIDTNVAIVAIGEKNPEVMDTDGPRATLRQVCIDAATALTQLEEADDEFWEKHDWYLVIDCLATLIQAGEINLDFDEVLK